jgi:SecD/SecF fusion protein
MGNMTKKKGILVFILVLFLIGGLSYIALVGIGPEQLGSAKGIKLGLDLAGGVSITYEVTGETPSEEDMRDTIYKLQKRVENYSTEAQVYQEGTDRINIEIPGISDANTVLEELGKPGSLVFMDSSGNVVMTGTDVKNAQAGVITNQMGNNEYVVSLTLNEEGTEKFAKATAQAAKTRDIIYIIYDDEIISAPAVNDVITGGEASISGMSSAQAAETLASTIRIGGLRLELEELRSNVVGAQLGQEAIKTSIQAGIAGFIIIALIMCLVYLVPGLAASIALIFYVLLTFLLIKAFELTLTLQGIAGIILSVGMAVDANVIIFARIREELKEGKAVGSAIKIGFQKALSAIVDGNITTLIAAAVLGFKATGSVKGFAQTLALGIVVSMFTALVITRLILNAMYAIGLKNEKLYSLGKERKDILVSKKISFVKRKNLFFLLSILLIASGFLFMGMNQSRGKGLLEYSLEFKGGTSTNITFQEDMSIEEIDSLVIPVVQEVTKDHNIQMQKVAGSKEVIFKTRNLSVEEREELNKKLVDEFKVDEQLITAENISSAISGEMRNDAVIAVFIAGVCMLLYIWFRFKDIRFGASAVFALCHDVLIVLAFYGVSRISVGNTFIACMLTIVGYSINATIVIFDRIRENLKETREEERMDVVDSSITQTLSRSIWTSLTTFAAVTVLYIFGVPSIKEFAAPLMVGILCGAYSSVCITGPLWYIMGKNRIKNGKE